MTVLKMALKDKGGRIRGGVCSWLFFFKNRTGRSLRGEIAGCEHSYTSEAQIRQKIIINFLCLFSRTINQFTAAAVSWLCITEC